MTNAATPMIPKIQETNPSASAVGLETLAHTSGGSGQAYITIPPSTNPAERHKDERKNKFFIALKTTLIMG
jgi:hypothetical protein